MHSTNYPDRFQLILSEMKRGRTNIISFHQIHAFTCTRYKKKQHDYIEYIEFPRYRVRMYLFRSICSCKIVSYNIRIECHYVGFNYPQYAFFANDYYDDVLLCEPHAFNVMYINLFPIMTASITRCNVRSVYHSLSFSLSLPIYLSPSLVS